MSGLGRGALRDTPVRRRAQALVIERGDLVPAACAVFHGQLHEFDAVIAGGVEQAWQEIEGQRTANA